MFAALVMMMLVMMMTFMTFYRLSSIVFRLTMLYIPFFVRMHVVCVVVMDMHRKRKPRDAVAARALHMDVDAF